MSLLCKIGLHHWVSCTIKWLDGGPYMAWHVCNRCDILPPTIDGDKWKPFTIEKDSTYKSSPTPVKGGPI